MRLAADPEVLQDPEVLAARGEVELAKAELASRLREVSRSSKKKLVRVGRKALPVAAGLLLVAGALVTIRALRARARARRGVELAPPEPSLLRVALLSALRGTIQTLATRAAEQALARVIADAHARATSQDETPCSAPVTAETARAVALGSPPALAGCVSTGGAR